jgi:rhodanese-related sulfurtransferase
LLSSRRRAFVFAHCRSLKRGRSGNWLCCHVTGAVNIPHTKLEKHMNELRKANGVVLYCIFGKRTRLAEQTLIEHDIPNVMHLEGGLNGWRQSGFEVRAGWGP